MCRSAPLAVLLLATLAACGLDEIDVNASRRAVIQGHPAGALADLPLAVDGLASFDVAGSREFAKHGAEPDDIDSVKLTSLLVTVEGPSGATLDFVDRVEFFASAPGLPTVKIATMDVAPGATTTRARVVDAELKDHATARSMTLSSRILGRQPREDTTVRVDAVLRVDVALGPF